MIKRPKILYVIAIWTLLQQIWYVSLPLRLVFRSFDIPAERFHLTLGILIIGVIAVLVGLVRLGTASRWLVVWFLSCAVINHLIVFFLTLLNAPLTAKYLGINALIILGSISCLVYLARPSFGKLAIEYRAAHSPAQGDDPLGALNEELLKGTPKL